MSIYFVDINSTVLVKTEIDGSCAAAEHHFLQMDSLVKTANAFDEKAMKTETFIATLWNREVMDEYQFVERLADAMTKRTDAKLANRLMNEALSTLEKAQKEYDKAAARADEERREFLKSAKAIWGDVDTE